MSKIKKQHKGKNKEGIVPTVNNQYLMPGVTAFVLIVLISCKPYLRALESLNLFVGASDYFRYCMEMPGGLLAWCATWLTQLFYHPWLGAIVYACMALLCMWMTVKALDLRGAVRYTGVIPMAMTVLSLMSLGYLIFSIKSPGIAFTPLLGLLSVCGILWIQRSLTSVWSRLVMVVVIVVAGYSLFGAYALIAAVICVIYECTLWVRNRRQWASLLTMAVGIVLIVIWPKCWWAHVGGRLMISDLYTAILPRFNDDEWSMWVPYIIAYAYMAIMTVVAPRLTQQSRVAVIINEVIGAGAMLSVIAICFCTFDTNLKNTLRMLDAIDQQRWTDVNDIARNQKETPTRLNVWLNNIAVFNEGKGDTELFAYPNGSAPYNTTRSQRAIHDIGASLISYHLGHINYAYRWAMENKVEYGTRVNDLKMMVKTALLNGDYNLARKHIDTLSQTMWHKGWAEKYRKYAEDPSLIEQDEEMSRIRRIMPREDTLGIDQGGFELYLLPAIAHQRAYNAEMLDLSIQCALMAKDLDTFLQHMPQYAAHHKSIPRMYQEAAMMWCYLHDSDAYREVGIDQSVIDGFGQFVGMFQQYERMDPQALKEVMRPAFGNTYWYYYAILDDLLVI